MKGQTAWMLVIVSATVYSPCLSAGEPSSGAYDLLTGSYRLIGKLPDSNKTYTGEIELKRAKGGLDIIRHVSGRTYTGTARIETVTADNVPILRMRFSDGVTDYEGTYLWRTDLDNYARITGYLYSPGSGTNDPGLEALFIRNRDREGRPPGYQEAPH